jgi:hypothetical protein
VRSDKPAHELKEGTSESGLVPQELLAQELNQCHNKLDLSEDYQKAYTEEDWEALLITVVPGTPTTVISWSPHHHTDQC